MLEVGGRVDPVDALAVIVAAGKDPYYNALKEVLDTKCSGFDEYCYWDKLHRAAITAARKLMGMT